MRLARNLRATSARVARDSRATSARVARDSRAIFKNGRARFQKKKHLQGPKAPIVPEWKFDLTSDIHDRLSLESSRADLCGQGLRKLQ